MPLAEDGSQRWLQIVVNRRPGLLLERGRKARWIRGWYSPEGREQLAERRRLPK
jgi:hypothetical protein